MVVIRRECASHYEGEFGRRAYHIELVRILLYRAPLGRGQFAPEC